MRMLVFLLMVIVDGEEQGTQNMYFASVNTCNYYADRIERKQIKVTAYCVPKMVNQNQPLVDYGR